MRATAIVILGFIAANGAVSTKAEEAPKRTPELQILDRFTGEWETTVTNKATGEKTSSTQNCKWTREGTFIHSQDKETESKKEAHFLVTYDAKTKQYRAVFINDEYTVPLLGTWDEKAQTMSWTSADTPYKNTVVDRFIDKDHIEWSMTVTSPEGNVVLELSAKQSRRGK